MILDINFGGKSMKIELPAKVQVEIVRDLQELYKKYCTANPSENISFDNYLKLVENSPHPENVPPENEGDTDDDDDIDLELGLLNEAIKRKDYIIETLLATIGKIK
jgi:hypothetical protein